MERLTNTDWKNLDPWECCGQDSYCQRGCHDEGGCTNGCVVPQIYRMLATYEDTGLTPEEIKKLIDRDVAKRVDGNDCCPICNTYGKDDEDVEGEFCPNCGQRLDWGYPI